MRALIQRVTNASVSIAGEEKASIAEGLLIFLGIEEADTEEDAVWLSGKIARLRIFRDVKDVMNLSIRDTGGSSLVISQFTLHASTRKGNRPSYIRAATPEKAVPLYEMFISRYRSDSGCEVKTGEFGACMQIESLNDGPVTIFIDSKNRE
jgi:D-tyrosyl-tRNA(Tyr) deacylase